MKPRVLLVEDEPNMVRTLSKILERREMEVATAANGKDALARLADQSFDILVTDLNMPVMDGMTLLRELKEHPKRPTILVLTGYGTIQSAVEAMRLGAADYLIKPCNPDELILVIEREMEVRELRREVETLRREVHRHQRFGSLIGESEAMQRVYAIIDTVSQNKSTVLITGASGTGKELVARTLHGRSPWSRGPFVALNCGAVSETLLDSQLFGHRRGAFTGAIGDQEGVFQAAHGGTLFLDEVSEIPLSLQGKFLRAIQEREVTPLGTTRPIRFDVRLVAATNRDLPTLVREGSFREDLYYRLNVVNLHLPALSARAGDIPILVAHFVNEFSASFGVEPKEVSEEAMRALCGHPWPGNVRELQNTIERAFALSRSAVIEASDLGLEAAADLHPLRPGSTSGNLADQQRSGIAEKDVESPLESLASGEGTESHEDAMTLEDAEKRAIARAMERARGNKNEAARLLQIDRQRLYRKLEKYGF